VGETRVDLLHLIEDLRDAYPGSLEETILTEIVANSLDSGAARLYFRTDPGEATLTVIDDGSGMKARELSRYHDIAASAKVRGEGIGFAGVGIKLALLVCGDVLTETRRGPVHLATTWHLASRHRAPWKRVPPPGLVDVRGTAVRLALRNPLSPLLDPGFVEAVLGRHFEPLFDPAFDEILAPHYPDGVRFIVNGRGLGRAAPATGRVPLAIRLGRKRKPAAVGWLVRDGALPEDERGMAVSTLGKVIKRGWDWLGLTPATPGEVGGLIEVPALAGCLTLNKADFIRSGPRGMTYLAYRKAMQEVVAAQLAAWGEARDTAEEERRRRARPIERDLATVLVDLAEDFPLLSSLVEQHAGGQRRLAVGRAGDAAPPLGPVRASATPEPSLPEAGEPAPGGPAGDVSPPASGPSAGAPEPEAAIGEAPHEPSGDLALPGGRGPKRPTRYGLSIRFEPRPEDPELGRLVESTVWVNEAHPAFRRAVASRSEGYHLALTVAMALAPLAAEPAHAHRFVTAFLARWGAGLERKPAGSRRRLR
jgi:hypothetical protein